MSERIVAGVITADWGPIRVAASSRGLVAVDQLVTAEAFADRLERRFGATPVDAVDVPSDSPAAGHLQAGLVALGAFLGGDLAALDAIPIDLADRTGWDRLVLGAVRGIRPGATASYGEVARMIGKAGAARAVGGAVGRNPLGLVIPCHRVIAGDGSLGGYGGGWWGGRATGLELKRDLLAREGVSIRPWSAPTKPAGRVSRFAAR
jgi:methylated-DNA-[protein]-cysteine S-methyltransferase